MFLPLHTRSCLLLQLRLDSRYIGQRLSELHYFVFERSRIHKVFSSSYLLWEYIFRYCALCSLDPSVLAADNDLILAGLRNCYKGRQRITNRFVTCTLPFDYISDQAGEFNFIVQPRRCDDGLCLPTSEIHDFFHSFCFQVHLHECQRVLTSISHNGAFTSC